MKSIKNYYWIFTFFSYFEYIIKSIGKFYSWLTKDLSNSSNLSQLQSMLSCLDNVLFLISAGYPVAQKEWDYPIIVFDGFHEFMEALEGQDDKEKAPFIDTLFQYISRNSEIAHFVLVGENYNGEEIIKQNRHVKAGKTTIIDFPDLTEEEATTYLSSLVTNASPEDIKLAISKLGGRTSDLQSLVARIKMGNTLVEALNELTTQAEQVIRTQGFGGKYLGASTKKWSQVHLWKAAKKIVQNSSPAYDDILFSAFSGDNEALKALLKNNILRVQKKSGIKVVTAFSPLYLTAFQKMVNETPQLKKALDLLEKKSRHSKRYGRIS